jgi:serine/threonine-protein kinase 11
MGDSLASLEREVRLLRMFRHPNILRLIEVLHIPSTDEVYLVLEYAENGCLGSITQQLPSSAIFSIIKQISHALEYLHQAGYVHQDIKPSNILLDGSGRAMLADFGIGHSFVSASMVVGSPAYQAPEALDDGYSEGQEMMDPAKEDVWALGVTLYQLLFGRLPFGGDNLFEIVRQIKERPLEIPEGTDPDVVILLKGMLCVEVSERLGIKEVLDNLVIRNAESRAEGVPQVTVMAVREGEVEILKGEVWADGVSFGEIAEAASRRRSNLQMLMVETKGRCGGKMADEEFLRSRRQRMIDPGYEG